MEGCLKIVGWFLLLLLVIYAAGEAIEGIESLLKSHNDKKDKDEETEWINSYNEAIKENDFEKAHNILEDIYTEYKIGDRSAKFTLDAYSDVYGAEFRYLILSGDESAKDKIAYMFTEIPTIGEKLNSGTVYKEYMPNEYGDYKNKFTLYNKDFDNYLTYSKCINGLCNLILDLAIQNNKYEFATIAIDHYVESVSFKKTLDTKDADSEYDDTEITKIYYDESAKEAAQAKLDKAIEEGKIQKSE